MLEPPSLLPLTDSSDELSTARARIAAAYDPDTLEAAGQKLTAVLAEHLRHVQAGQGNVLNWTDPPELVRQAEDWLRRPGSSQDLPDRIAELAQESLARGINLHHRRYVGHQVPASMPLAGLLELVSSVTNQVMAIYEMGPWATAIEHAVVEAVGRQLGFTPGQFTGLVTSGGSLANLTALLTARPSAIMAAIT